MTSKTFSSKEKLFAVMIAALTFTSLTGCAGGSDSAEPSEPSPASSEESSGGDDDDDANDPSCLIGDWIATESGLKEWYQAFVPDDAVIVNSVTGEILISFSETDFIYSTSELTVSMTIGDQNATTTITGGTAGTYETLGDGIMSTTVDTDNLDASATVSGIEFTASDLGIELSGASSFSGYECTGGNLVLETQSAGTGTAIIALEPAG